ncbi:XRE family transcriptional regulator [Streptomyces benahoarensis]|uniref:XRE family transcriptional regulator n=1 Tax=Streptomyces benahoarensis TaxID=2595054 RepID=A0A553Z785_9ACTN|nr:XRE family transcriptional regulator [Streptomyces benahoarensis]TSB24020.1 XRE family transcriptional regulator [Streptomyces benahoarensis]TSB37294.1 XRE family transcriptional regulator [Streptomyces benahoarensis]
MVLAGQAPDAPGRQPRPQPLRAPDTPLGRARLARGWSRERTVRALMALADRWGWQIATEDSLKVQLHRWEHQQSRPSETYRVMLCALFRVTPDELGFSAQRAMTETALNARVESLESMVAQLTNALARTLGATA